MASASSDGASPPRDVLLIRLKKKGSKNTLGYLANRLVSSFLFLFKFDRRKLKKTISLLNMATVGLFSLFYISFLKNVGFIFALGHFFPIRIKIKETNSKDSYFYAV